MLEVVFSRTSFQKTLCFFFDAIISLCFLGIAYWIDLNAQDIKGIYKLLIVLIVGFISFVLVYRDYVFLFEKFNLKLSDKGLFLFNKKKEIFYAWEEVKEIAIADIAYYIETTMVVKLTNGKSIKFNVIDRWFISLLGFKRGQQKNIQQLKQWLNAFPIIMQKIPHEQLSFIENSDKVYL